MSDTVLELVLRRDRTVIVSALGLLLALAWAYVLWIATYMDMGGMPQGELFDAIDLVGEDVIPALAGAAV